jgi:uncharacterized tellurite resistance protein B-like protein
MATADVGTTVETVNTYITSYRDAVTAELVTMGEYRPGTFNPTVESAPDLNTVGSIAVQAFEAIVPVDFTVTNPNAKPYQALDVNALPVLTSATMDTGAAGTFISNFGALQPSLFTWLQAQIEATVSSGGQNISTEVQDALFNTGYERDLQTYRDALDLTGAKTGAKGSRYPNSMTKVMQAQAQVGYTNQKYDMSREIVKNMANLAQENIKAAISAGVSIDEARVSVFTQTSNALAEIQRLSLEQYKTDLQSNLQVFEGQLRLQLLDLEVQKADRGEMREYISAEREQIGLENRVNISEFEAKNKLKTLQADVDKLIAELQISGNEQKIRSFAAYVQQLDAVQRIDLSNIQENNKLQVELMRSIASSYGEIMKSMSVQAVAVVTKKT